jgi:chromosome segregation ATPase
MPVLAQVDAELIDAVGTFAERVQASQLFMLGLFVVVIGGMVVGVMLARGALTQTHALLMVVKSQGETISNINASNDKVQTRLTSQLDLQTQTLTAHLETLRTMNSRMDTQETSLKALSEREEANYGALDERFSEALNLINKTSAELSDGFLRANQALDAMRHELGSLAETAQQQAEEGEKRFRTYEHHNGEQNAKLAEMTHILKSVSASLTAIKSDVGAVEKRTTDEIKTVNLLEKEKPE